ncbi:MAG: LuxR C-terminal-related transcriptional regulator [Halanaerobiales bacterium]
MNIEQMYFDYKLIKEEVTSSWTRCLQHEKSRHIQASDYIYGDKSTDHISENVKKYFSEKVKIINKRLNQNYIFFLINNKYIIEEVAADFTKNNKLKQEGIKRGFSFSEEFSGTNAVFLAGKLKKPVHILPGHHFCEPLNGWYSIATPIMNNDKIYGFINVIHKNIIKNEIICLSNLLVDNIQLKITNKTLSYSRHKKEGLTKKQSFILKQLAKGLTDKALARKVHLSESTIQYHKKKLFNFFKAHSKVELIVKAFKNGFLTFEEVSFKKRI